MMLGEERIGEGSDGGMEIRRDGEGDVDRKV